jgi:hypothetical protein
MFIFSAVCATAGATAASPASVTESAITRSLNGISFMTLSSYRQNGCLALRRRILLQAFARQRVVGSNPLWNN